jgi:hypothetical protein
MAKSTAAKSLFRKDLRATPWRSRFYENDPQIKTSQLFKNQEFNDFIFSNRYPEPAGKKLHLCTIPSLLNYELNLVQN